MQPWYLLAVLWVFSMTASARRMVKNVTGPLGGFSSLVYHPGEKGAISQMSISFTDTNFGDNFVLQEPITMNNHVKELMHSLHTQHYQQQKQSELHFHKRKPAKPYKALESAPENSSPRPNTHHNMFRNTKYNRTRLFEPEVTTTTITPPRNPTRPPLFRGNRGHSKYQSTTKAPTTTPASEASVEMVKSIPLMDYSSWMSMKVKKENEDTKFHGSESNIIALKDKNLRKPLINQETISYDPMSVFNPKHLMTLWSNISSHAMSMISPEMAYNNKPKQQNNIYKSNVKWSTALKNKPMPYTKDRERHFYKNQDQKLAASQYVNELIQNVMSKNNETEKEKNNTILYSNSWTPQDLVSHSQTYQHFIPSIPQETEIYKIMNLPQLNPSTQQTINTQTKIEDQRLSENINIPEINKGQTIWSTQIEGPLNEDKFIPMENPHVITNSSLSKSMTNEEFIILKKKILSDERLSNLISSLGSKSKHEYKGGKHIITGPEDKGVFFRIIVEEPSEKTKENSQKTKEN